MMSRGKSVVCLMLTGLLCLFAACGFAATLTLPANLKTIQEEAFYGDTSLDEVVLPEGLERIESRAFAESSVKEIKEGCVVINTKDGEKTIEVDSVISSIGYHSYAPLYKEKTAHLHVLGDAKTVGNLKTAIWGANDLVISFK